MAFFNRGTLSDENTNFPYKFKVEIRGCSFLRHIVYSLQSLLDQKGGESIGVKLATNSLPSRFKVK